jgi:hypothetical protein
MAPWTIILSSAVSAIVVSGVLVIPELANAPRAEIGAALFQHLPALAVGALGVYGLGAMLLTTVDLVADLLRMRQQLTRAAMGAAPAWHDWVAAFGTRSFRRLATSLPPRGSDTASDGAELFTTCNASEARSEIARTHYISLAKSHFLSVLIILIGIVGLGIAQDHGVLPFQSGAIPTASAILIVVGLVLLAALGRIAIDVTAEPLLEAITQPSPEPNEVGLLRRVVALLEPARDAAEAGRIYDVPSGFSEQLLSALEEGNRPLLDAFVRLSENTQSLEATLHSSVAAFETNIRSAGAQQPVDGSAISLTELQAAVEELTAVLRRLSAAPEEARQPVPVGRRTTPAALSPGLAGELRRLLAEIDAGR